MNIYLDWDCTITIQHQYHLLSPAYGTDTSELGLLLASSISDGARKLKGLEAIVDRLSAQYALWGRKGKEVPQELAKLTQSSTALVDRTSPDEELIYDELLEIFFGDEQRRNALNEFIISQCERGVSVCILTKGLTGAVYSAILSFWEPWTKFPIKIVDYAGQCLTMNTMAFKLLNTRLLFKLGQIVEMELDGGGATQCACALVDDSFEEEIKLEWLGKPLVKSKKFQFYAVQVPLDGGRTMHLSVGGTKKNSSGLGIKEFAYLNEYFSQDTH